MTSPENVEAVLAARVNEINTSIHDLESDRRSALNSKRNGEMHPQSYRKFSRGVSLRIRLEQARRGEVNTIATMLGINVPIPPETTRRESR